MYTFLLFVGLFVRSVFVFVVVCCIEHIILTLALCCSLIHMYVRMYIHTYICIVYYVSLPRCHPVHFDFGSSCPLGEEQQLRLKVVNLSGIASSFHASVVHFPAATPPAPPSKPRPSKGCTLTASRTLCANTVYSHCVPMQCVHFCEDHTYTYTCACVYVCVYTYMYSTLYIRTLYIYVCTLS